MPVSLSPHIVLEELQIPFEAQAVTLRSPDLPAELLKANPLGGVPVLITDKGDALLEGAVILQYLGDLKPEAGLIPKAGTWERYKFHETLNFISTELHKGFSPVFAAGRMPNEIQAPVRTFFKEALGKRLDIAAQKIGSRPYLMGERFTVADAYLFTVLRWTKNVDMDLGKWPVLKTYFDRVLERPAVQRTMKTEGLL